MSMYTGTLLTTTSILVFAIRKAVSSFGLWDQLRVDHGSEFFLTLFIHGKLCLNYGSPSIIPYIQTPSTQVHLHFSIMSV